MSRRATFVRRPDVMLASMKVGQVLRLLRREGWYRVPSRGGHRQFKHAHRPGRVTVSGKASDDLSPKTLKSILLQAGLTEGTHDDPLRDRG